MNPRICLIICFMGAVLQLTSVACADDAALFRQARRAQLHLDFQTAAGLYGQVQEVPWNEAAMCYRAQSLAALGQSEQAIELYQRYLINQSHQDYRGEVLLELSRLQCLLQDQKKGLSDARDNLQRATSWVEQQLQQKHGRMGDDPGNNSPLFVGPETVLNASTTPWYLPKLQTKILLLRVYVATLLNDQDKALAALDELEKISKDHKPQWISLQTLVNLRVDVNRGCFLLPMETWQLLTPENAPAIRMGCFYSQTGEIDLAQPLLLAVHKLTAEGSGKAEDWAACELGLASCDVQLGHPDQAITRLQLFAKLLRATSASPMGRYMLANTLASNQSNLPKVYQLYADLTQDSNTGLANPSGIKQQALLAMLIVALNHGDSSTAFRAADRLNIECSGTHQAQIASLIIADQTSASSTKGKTPILNRSNGAPLNRSYVYHLQKAVILPNLAYQDLSISSDTPRVLTLSTYAWSNQVLCSSLTPQVPLSHPFVPTKAQQVYVIPASEIEKLKKE